MLSLEKQLEQRDQDYKDLKEEHDLVKVDLEAKAEEWEIKYVELEIQSLEEKERLESKIAALQDDNKFLEKELAKAKSELQSVTSKFEKNRKKVVELENALDKIGDKFRFKETLAEDLQAELESTLEKLTILETEALETSSPVPEKNGDSEPKEKEIKKDEKDKTKIKEMLHNLNDELIHKYRMSVSIKEQGTMTDLRWKDWDILMNNAINSLNSVMDISPAVSLVPNGSTLNPLGSSNLTVSRNHSPSPNHEINERIPHEGKKKSKTMRSLITKLDGKIQAIKNIFSSKKEPQAQAQLIQENGNGGEDEEEEVQHPTQKKIEPLVKSANSESSSNKATVSSSTMDSS